MKITKEEAMANPVLRAAIEGTLKAPSAAQEAKSMLQGVNPAYPLVKAKGSKRRVPGQMSKLEQEYAAFLDAEVRAGRVLWFAYEGMKLKLAEKTFYTPDFILLTPGHFIEAHEVKGHWRMFQNDGGRIKIKCAAEKWWWITFKGVTKMKAKDAPYGHGWKVEEFK